MARLTRSFGGPIGLEPALLTAARSAQPASLPGRSVASGRTALRLIARALDGPLLLPSYLCESMIQPLREEGIPFAFYAIRADLRADVDDLVAQVRRIRPAAVVAIAYFGHPVDPALADALSVLKGEVRVVEDCVQGSLLESAVGGIGDFAFTSFRKYLPLPDGGFVTGPLAATLPELPPADGQHVVDHLLARTLRGAVGPLPAGEVEETFVELEHRGERALDTATPLEGASLVSRQLLTALDLPAATARRRENHRALAEALAGIGVVAALQPSLPDRVSPLVLPVRVTGIGRDALQERLRSLRVFAPVYWPLPAEVDPRAYPDAAELSRSLLGLPVDQRYGADDMHELAERVREAASSVAGRGA